MNLIVEPTVVTPASRRVYAFALLFCVLLYGPFAGVLFNIGGIFLPEIPILICLATIFAYSGHEQRRRFAVALLMASPVIYAIILFAIVGLLRGTPFDDVYSDFRAIVALVVSYALISAVNDYVAIRFIVFSSAVSIVLYALSIVLGFGEQIFTKSTFDLGKITIPIFSFVFAIMYLSGKNKVAFFLLISSLTVIVGASSLRYLFLLLLYTFAVGGNFLIFGYREEVWRAASVLSLIALGAIAFIIYANLDLVQFLNWAQLVARQIGFGEQAIHQVLVKTMQNITDGINYGDAIYVSFLSSIFDFERFYFPRGIGHESSIGDPAIFSGNTIDNSIVYLNYHFSIFVTIIMMGVTIAFFSKLAKKQSVGSLVILALFSLPIIFIFYMRAIAFVSVAEAISLALAVRGLQLLAGELRQSASGLRARLKTL